MITKRYFELIDEKSSKFWEINVTGKRLNIRYGKIGTDGQTTLKELASSAEAEAQLEKLVLEKTKKGYVEGGYESIKNKNLDGKSNALEPWPFAIDANTAKKLNKIKTGELQFDSEEKNKNKKQLKHKFYPCTYRLELGEDGGDLYIGKVNRATYNFFKEQKIDIDAYASLDWDNKKVIPAKFQPFPSGSPDYCDNLISASGATMDNNNLVKVFNEKDDEIWKCSMDSNTLDDEGVIAEEMKEFYLSDLKEGTVVFYGVKGEKGTFFSGEIKLNAPFNPKKLKLEYVDADGWLLCNSVFYDEKIIDNTNCSTTLKYTQNKWIIVGGEKVYE